MIQKPYLNAGCGKVILPAEQPTHHYLVDPALYHYPLWTNADRNTGQGVDKVVDLFTYPWPWPDNSFDGALLAHIVEHIPHEMYASFPKGVWADGSDPGEWDSAHGKRLKELLGMQDGWYAFFSELYRVLTPGAIAHIVTPYAWTQGMATDPTHTRFITEHVWTHEGMRRNASSPFTYASACDFRMVEPCKIGISRLFHGLLDDPTQPYIQQDRHNWNERIVFEFQTRVNVAADMYTKLEAIK